MKTKVTLEERLGELAYGVWVAEVELSALYTGQVSCWVAAEGEDLYKRAKSASCNARALKSTGLVYRVECLSPFVGVSVKGCTAPFSELTVALSFDGASSVAVERRRFFVEAVFAGSMFSFRDTRIAYRKHMSTLAVREFHQSGD